MKKMCPLKYEAGDKSVSAATVLTATTFSMNALCSSVSALTIEDSFFIINETSDFLDKDGYFSIKVSFDALYSISHK